MKKLKFLALGLIAAFGFVACGEDPEDEESAFSKSTIVMGGAKSDNGSFYTFDKGVQTKIQLGDVATNVVFCFQTIDGAFQFISGTEATNEIVKAQATETKFVMIGDAKESKFEKADFAGEGSTTIAISNKLESGRKAVAFQNEKCEGFFEIINYTEESEDLTIDIWVKK